MDKCSRCLKKWLCCSNDGATVGVDQVPQNPLLGHTAGLEEGLQIPPLDTPVDVEQGLQNPPSGTSESPATALTTWEDWRKHFKETIDEGNVDALIQVINQLFMSKLDQASTSTSDSPSGSTDLIPNSLSVIDKGATFLTFVSEHTDKMDVKDGLFGSGEGQKVLQDILRPLGQLHWIVGGLTIIAHLLNKIEKVSENGSECLKLLKRMFDLSNRIKTLKDQMPEEEEKFRNPLVLIVKGCMTCAWQLHSGKFFRFLKSSVDSQALTNLSSEIDRLYPDLTLDALIGIKKGQPRYLPLLHPKYPQGAVGLEKPLRQLYEKLDIQTTDVSSRVVVIYGFGGIGKSTLANALVATVDEDLKSYNYTKIDINEDPVKNDVKNMQEQILRHCFPTYQPGDQKLVSSCEDGRNHMTEAFKCEDKKPVFIFIDNALRCNDLEDLLPEDLQGLPHRSRILVTTRNLSVTDFFEEAGLIRHQYAVNTLSQEDALKILCKDPAHLDQIRNHVEEILRITGGIPLVLKIVGARLKKHKYKVENSSQILEALKDGGEVTEDNMSERLVNFVYNGLEPSTREAFLDICSFFNDKSRRFVEYTVGVEEVTSLAEAALITFSPFFNSVEELFSPVPTFWEAEEKVFVHDIIRAKGRSMGESTRIKDLESWSRAAERQVQGIKGVWLELEDQKYVIEERHLSWLRNSLRILSLGSGISISASSSERFDKLRYLQLHENIDCFPMNLEGLPSLSVYDGPFLNEFVTNLPQKLKHLRCSDVVDEGSSSSLRHSKSIQAIPNSSLEELLLFGRLGRGIMLDGRLHFDELKILCIRCEEMEELPPQVCGLPCLTRLILRGCSSLNRVPKSFANLRELRHLDLSGCSDLVEVCSSLGELAALRYLDLSGCTSIRKLPDNFGQLSALEFLSLNRCRRLEELPENFAQLRSLKGLDLSWCWGLRKLPPNFVQLASLRVLRMRGGVVKLLTGLGEIDTWKII